MSLPYFNLNYDTIVHFFYEINDIDTLNRIVNLKINNNNPPKNIIRIINSWIKFNYNDLKKYNNFILREPLITVLLIIILKRKFL